MQMQFIAVKLSLFQQVKFKVIRDDANVLKPRDMRLKSRQVEVFKNSSSVQTLGLFRSKKWKRQKRDRMARVIRSPFLSRLEQIISVILSMYFGINEQSILGCCSGNTFRNIKIRFNNNQEYISLSTQKFINIISTCLPSSLIEERYSRGGLRSQK